MAGFSLVEVLVAVVLLSIGLLGLAKLQVWGVRHTGSAYFRTQATQIANEMAERIRANPAAAYAGTYLLNRDACRAVQCADLVRPGCDAADCSSEELARYDVFTMACGGRDYADDGLGADDLLPGGGLRLFCDGRSDLPPLCTVEVCWREAEVAAADTRVQLLVVP